MKTEKHKTIKHTIDLDSIASLLKGTTLVLCGEPQSVELELNRDELTKDVDYMLDTIREELEWQNEN